MKNATGTYTATTSEGHILTFHVHGTPEETIRRHIAEDVPDAVEVPTAEENMLRFEASDGWWSENRW